MSDVVLRYQPARPGDYLAGIPARDLTAADLAADPSIAARATAPGPRGTPMYQPVKQEPVRQPAKEPSLTGGRDGDA